MSWWFLPTTADIGLRAFSDSAAGALREAALGMQEIQIATGATISNRPLMESTWTVDAPTKDYDRPLVQ